MSLCINYCAPDMDYIDVAPEIKIKLNAKDDTLKEFVEKHANQHIYITIDENFFKNKKEAKRLQEIKELDNWSLILPVELIQEKDNPNNIDHVKLNAIQDICSRYIFSDKVGGWEILQFILSLNPSEVYITNILGFDLPNVKKACAGVKIRVYANVAQAAWNGLPAIKKFFIRPEDVQIYEQYVDSIEFIGDAPIQEVCYKAYSRGSWHGDLSEIIIGLGDSLDSRRLPQYFGILRADCKKRCLMGGRCSSCRSMVNFAQRMEKTNTQIIPPSKQN